MILRNRYFSLRSIRWASSGPHPTKHSRHRLQKPKPVIASMLVQKELNTSLFYSPPSSPPDYKVTPYLLLPESVKKSTEKPLFQGTLPPPLSPFKQKKYHLKEEDIKTIKALREQGVSRSEIAKRFNASSLFIGMVAPLSKEKIEEIKRKKQEIISRWSDRKKQVIMDRQKRRKLWGQEY